MKGKINTNWERLKLFFGVLALVVGVSTQTYAQKPVHELNEVVHNQTNTRGNHSVEQLCRGMVPSLILMKNEINQTDPEDNPVRVITDIASINMLYESNPLYNKVEVVIIQVNDLSQFNDMQLLKPMTHMTKLDYIYFSCSFELCIDTPNDTNCEKGLIKTKVNDETTPTVIYTSELNQ